jgi:hypothetical protein
VDIKCLTSRSSRRRILRREREKKRKMFIYKIGLKVFNVPCLKTEDTKEEKKGKISKGKGENEIGLKVFNVPCLKTEDTKGEKRKK